jgi:uncharacterized paraquat-inducible protein A
MTPPSPSLLAQRCHHHAGREAVARCPECGLFYCRECVTEHEDRVVCAGCLRKSTGRTQARRNRFAGIGRALLVALGIMLAWFFFYSAGRLLLLTPTSFHEGTLWEKIGGSE